MRFFMRASLDVILFDLSSKYLIVDTKELTCIIDKGFVEFLHHSKGGPVYFSWSGRGNGS